jgi:hypothetical protein
MHLAKKIDALKPPVHVAVALRGHEPPPPSHNKNLKFGNAMEPLDLNLPNKKSIEFLLHQGFSPKILTPMIFEKKPGVRLMSISKNYFV